MPPPTAFPKGLVLALAKAESSFRPEVKSPVGAIGLMQLMPATARMTAGYKGKKPYNPLWLVDPEYNIRLGTKHLRDLLDQYHQDHGIHPGGVQCRSRGGQPLAQGLRQPGAGRVHRKHPLSGNP